MQDADTSSGNDQQKQRRLVVDSPALHIEEVRPPDSKRERKLKDYASDQRTGWLKPMAGDQGRLFFHAKHEQDSPQMIWLLRLSASICTSGVGTCGVLESADVPASGNCAQCNVC